MDLNIENGVIEKPVKPMIRVGKPVFNKKGKKVGIFLVNYLAGRLLKKVVELDKQTYEYISLINSDGYYLASNKDIKMFGFMYNIKDSSLKTTNPDIWNRISQISKSQFISKDNIIYTTQKIALGEDEVLKGEINIIGLKAWYLISEVPIFKIIASHKTLKYNLILFGGSFIMLLIIIIYSVYNSKVKEELAKERQTELMLEHAEAAEKQHKYLQNLINSLPFPFYVIDANTYKITLVNSALPDVIIGESTCHKITHKDDHPCNSPEHGCPLQIVRKSGKPCQLEHIHEMKDGKNGYFLVHGIPLFDSKGKLTHMIEFSINIDDRKKIEIALQHAKDLADDAVKAKSDFLAMMSHEIRTPMNGVIGMAELLSSTALDVEQADYTNTIKTSGESLLTIINDILDFSKIDAKKLELDKSPMNLSECIEEVFELLAPKAGEKNIELLYLIDPSVPISIYGDVTRLKQILINLANNALKFTKKGEIFITVNPLKENKKSKELMLEFIVRDSGIGIPKEKLEVLFDAFSQADTSTTREYGGTGLGLAIAKRLIELMQGSIHIESEVGVGSSFIFNIKTKEAPVTIKTYMDPENYNFKDHCALVVDDNKINRQILEVQLKTWDLNAYFASSAEEATKVLNKNKEQITFGIFDYQMPDKNGAQLAQELRQDGYSKEKFPILLLSSVGTPYETLSKNFNKMIAKPVKKSILFAALLEVLHNEKKDIKIKKKVDLPFSKDFAKENPVNILVAEDNKINQKLIVRIFEKMGYNIDLAVDGTEAVEKATSNNYDIIFMDCQMPNTDGYEATQLLREKGNKTKIIAMTANAMQGDKEKCLDAGMNDYLTKPIKIDAIKNAIHHHIN